jgi:hypothetical protein
MDWIDIGIVICLFGMFVCQVLSLCLEDRNA